MKTKPRKTPIKSRLHEFQLVEVTDPVEFAYLESRVRAAEKAMAERERLLAELENGKKPKSRKRK